MTPRWSSRVRRWTTRECRFHGDDSGNLIAVLILIVVLALLITVTVEALVPTFGTASTSQFGENAVAQANSGLSDALFRLDQLGDNASSFCVGTGIPSSLLTNAGLTSSDCLSGSGPPLSNAPGLQYYVVRSISSGLKNFETSEVEIDSHAVVKGQARTVTALIYRVADGFAVFGKTSITANGSLTNAPVYSVGGFPLTSPVEGGTVYIGVGGGGTITCNGTNGGKIIEIGQNGSTNTNSKCTNYQSQTTNFSPNEPTVCSGSTSSSAFSPCIDTSNFARTNGSTGSYYCPLPGLPASIQNPGNVSSVSVNPGPDAVFNCSSNGAAVTIGSTTTPTESSSCPSSTEPPVSPQVPGISSGVPPGSYYFDSSALTIAELDPCLFTNGNVSIYDLAQQPSSATLALNGQYMNAAQGTDSPLNFYPGNPSNFSLYWNGTGTISGPTGGGYNSKNPWVFDGYLYAPGASLTLSNGDEIFGSMVVNSLTVQGSPNFYLVYPQHPKQFLQNWTVSHYEITP